MQRSDPLRVGYVVKRYPRFSETFIVNEILAHERAGMPLDIFAVRRVNEPHFQSMLAEVRSPVTYIPDGAAKAELVWATLRQGKAVLPSLWPTLGRMDVLEVANVHQAVLLAIEVRRHGIEHLHAHFGTIATTIARLAAGFAGIGYSFTAHAKDIFHAEVDRDALREKLRDAAAVVTVSDFNRAWLRENYGAAAAGVRRIYNGLDLAAFGYSCPAERPREILAVGRLVEKKGFDTLIEACAVLRARGVGFHCTIIGDGLLWDSLTALVARHGLGDVVTLVGPRPQSEVIVALQNAAVFAAPCVVATDGDRDGLPTVVVEAMALGTPCVTTDVTGLSEI
ncbi:MAG: glycosyltransferase, partial [Sphingomonas bacterium]|nr:glycosyltransferase [Sphingomonas bacterium]